jgi:hypothetical protein
MYVHNTILGHTLTRTIDDNMSGSGATFLSWRPDSTPTGADNCTMTRPRAATTETRRRTTPRETVVVGKYNLLRGVGGGQEGRRVAGGGGVARQVLASTTVARYCFCGNRAVGECRWVWCRAGTRPRIPSRCPGARSHTRCRRCMHRQQTGENTAAPNPRRVPCVVCGVGTHPTSSPLAPIQRAVRRQSSRHARETVDYGTTCGLLGCGGPVEEEYVAAAMQSTWRWWRGSRRCGVTVRSAESRAAEKTAHRSPHSLYLP